MLVQEIPLGGCCAFSRGLRMNTPEADLSPKAKPQPVAEVLNGNQPRSVK